MALVAALATPAAAAAKPAAFGSKPHILLVVVDVRLASSSFSGAIRSLSRR